MVFVVNKDTIIARFEAWDPNCMEDAMDFINDNGFVLEHSEVNMNGDMVLWVK